MYLFITTCLHYHLIFSALSSYGGKGESIWSVLEAVGDEWVGKRSIAGGQMPGWHIAGEQDEPLRPGAKGKRKPKRKCTLQGGCLLGLSRGGAGGLIPWLLALRH